MSTQKEIQKGEVKMRFEFDRASSMGFNKKSMCEVCGHITCFSETVECDDCGEVICVHCAKEASGRYICGVCIDEYFKCDYCEEWFSLGEMVKAFGDEVCEKCYEEYAEEDTIDKTSEK